MLHPARYTLAALTLLAAGPSHAAMPPGESYPVRPIRIVVPFPPGGNVDTFARMLFRHVEEDLGQPMVIDNRGGANGILGADTVAKATPSLTVSSKPAKVVVKKTKAKVTATLAATGQTPTGTIAVTVGTQTYLADLKGGKATVTLPKFTTVGKKAVTVKYLGDDHNKSVSKKITLKVVKK